jgi:hypothetical protein
MVAHLATAARGAGRLTADLEIRVRDVETGAAVTAAIAKADGVAIDESTALGE